MPTLNRRADRLLNDSLQLIDAAGERSSKSQELALVAQNAWSPNRFVYRCERLDICDGRLAIVVGTGIAENYRYKSSNVLIRENGAWRAVASHVSAYMEN